MKKYKYSWYTVIKNYRFNSIFFRNLMLMLLITVLPFLCVLGMTNYFYDQIYENKEAAYVEKIRTTIYEDVDSLLKELRDKFYILAIDENVKLFSLSASHDNQLYSLDRIRKQIEMFKLTSEVIDDIYIYAPSSKMIFSSDGLTHYDHFDNQELIDRWNPNGSQYQFGYSRRKISAGYKETIEMYYSVKYGATTQGLLIIRIDNYNLQKKLEYGENIGLVITNQNMVVFDSTNQFQGKSVNDVDLFSLAFEKELTMNKKMLPYGLDVTLHMDSTDLSEAMAGIRHFTLGITILLLLVSVIFSFYISRKIYDPFAHILSALEEYSDSDNEHLLQNKNEVGYILHSISRTISQKKDVEEELLMRIKLLRKAQAVALQAQINPHFVDNTLETIKWMIVKNLGDDNDISEMLVCFSKLIHRSLENTDTFVTVADEVEYVKKYLFIQEKRFRDQFEVTWDIPDELKNCKVVNLSLQPIVENAINYGIKPFDEKGTIEIKAYAEDDNLMISVSNSGLGIPLEKVEEINKRVRENDIKESDHIGMSNVNQRIVLAFGPEYGVHLSSRIMEGTKVTLRFPLSSE